MVDSLPLIPHKSGACGDTRPVLREVFRELPPLVPGPMPPSCSPHRRHEGQLRGDRARRLAQPAPANAFRQGVHPSRAEAGPLRRHDLAPAAHQPPKCLWMGSTLRDQELLHVVGSALPLPAPRLHPVSRCPSLQSVSLCSPRQRAPPSGPLTPRAYDPPPAYIVCVPPRIDFIDFTVGQLHVVSVRVVNVSRSELRLSLSPPARRELSVQLAGARGLSVTSGADTELRVHFVPQDVRPLHDELVVRVSCGRAIILPVACYLRAPRLRLLLPVSSAPSAPSMPPTLVARDVLELGARLLGSVHYLPLELHCEDPRATFFLLTEDAWQARALRMQGESGVLQAGTFSLWPVAWRGGGVVRGAVWCCARTLGLHAVALRVLAGTAVARPLHVLADTLQYCDDHVTLVAQPRDCDVLSAHDEQCQYYVHLGTTHPGRALAGRVQLVNRSAVAYHYRWEARPWGQCACLWEYDQGAPDDELCEGALQARKQSGGMPGEWEAGAVRVELDSGEVAARCSQPVQLHVPDVGAALGTRRTVLLLVLLGVPEAALPPRWAGAVWGRRTLRPTVTALMRAPPVPVVDVVGAQLEVWWEVAPLRFVLDPCLVVVAHSRRVRELELVVRATQLHAGPGPRSARWRLPLGALAPPAPPLGPACSATTALRLPLSPPPDERTITDRLTLEAEGAECSATCVVQRAVSSRHPRLRPVHRWLGIVPPGARVSTVLTVTNDTRASQWWAAHAWRWLNARDVGAACRGRVPCAACQQRTCTCRLLWPTRALQQPCDAHAVHYEGTAPDHDGAVVSLVAVHGAVADERVECPGQGALATRAGSVGRAALVAYRVLAPRLLLRVLPCGGAKLHAPDCKGCVLDGGGGRVLRPARALALGARACCRLRVTNLTPLPTSVHWERPPGAGERDVDVTFSPNDFEVGAHATQEVVALLTAHRVCPRHVLACRARVQRAYRPLYLLIDIAVSGVEVELEWGLGGAAEHDSFAVLRRAQRAGGDCNTLPLREPAAVFAEEDRLRAALAVAKKTCRCRGRLVYVPEPRDPSYPPPIEIVTEPPPLHRVCACCAADTPHDARGQPLCVQLWHAAVGRVHERVLVLRNVSALPARWSAAVRRWPRLTVRTVGDPWACGVHASGAALQFVPAGGVLPGGARVEVRLRAYADSWGVYADQLALQVAGLAPLVLDVWLHAHGPPLQLAADHTLWISPSDEERTVRARNTSRADLVVQAYVLREHERECQRLPLRLYCRLYAAPARACHCRPALEKEVEEEQEQEEGLGVELWLGADWGQQQDAACCVTPHDSTLVAGAATEWRVRCDPAALEAEGPLTLLLRPLALPAPALQPHCSRPVPTPLRLRLQPAPRSAALHIQQDELCVYLCALTLPCDEIVRVRKRVRVQNTGNGWLHAEVRASEPWSVVTGLRRGACGCGPRTVGTRAATAPLLLPPRAVADVCVEVRVPAEVLRAPAPPPPLTAYAPPPLPPAGSEWRQCGGTLGFLGPEGALLHALALRLVVELPRLALRPAALELGCVCDGDARADALTVSHSSREQTLALAVQWEGSSSLTVCPRALLLAPGARGELRVQYAARWQPAPAEGCVMVWVRGSPWCCARAAVRAAPSRDHKCHLPPHDYTTLLACAAPAPGPAAPTAATSQHS